MRDPAKNRPATFTLSYWGVMAGCLPLGWMWGLRTQPPQQQQQQGWKGGGLKTEQSRGRPHLAEGSNRELSNRQPGQLMMWSNSRRQKQRVTSRPGGWREEGGGM
jgi:hypothetical protein